MKIEIILKFGILGAGILCLILFFSFIIIFTKRVTPTVQKEALNSLELQMNTYMKHSKIDSFNATSIQKKLKKYGITYASAGKFTPLMYVFFKFLLAFGLFALGCAFNIIVGFIAGIVGLNGLDIIFKLSNDDDNNKMLNDIQRFFNILKTQTGAGIALTRALTEAHTVVRNKRLKTALIELSSRVLAHESMLTAIEDFEEKFDNQYIHSFCIVVRQSLQSGQSENALSDLAGQITNIRKGMFLKEKANFDRKTAIIQLAIFAGIAGLIIVYMLNTMTNQNVF